MNTDGTGFYPCKECHQIESLWHHITTDHKEGEQLEDRRNVGGAVITLEMERIKGSNPWCLWWWWWWWWTMLVEENKLCSSALCALLIHSEVTVFSPLGLHIFLSILLSCRILEERMSRISSSYWPQSEMKTLFIYLFYKSSNLFLIHTSTNTNNIQAFRGHDIFLLQPRTCIRTLLPLTQ